MSLLNGPKPDTLNSSRIHLDSSWNANSLPCVGTFPSWLLRFLPGPRCPEAGHTILSGHARTGMKCCTFLENLHSVLQALSLDSIHTEP